MNTCPECGRECRDLFKTVDPILMREQKVCGECLEARDRDEDRMMRARETGIDI
jgi:hypothetical protein